MTTTADSFIFHHVANELITTSNRQIINKAIQSQDYKYRALVALNPNITESDINLLVRDSVSIVKYNLIKCNNITEQAKYYLLHDTNAAIHTYAITNLILTQSQYLNLYNRAKSIKEQMTIVAAKYISQDTLAIIIEQNPPLAILEMISFRTDLTPTTLYTLAATQYEVILNNMATYTPLRDIPDSLKLILSL